MKLLELPEPDCIYADGRCAPFDYHSDAAIRAYATQCVRDALEQAAQIGDRFAGYMENGAGELEPGERLRQVSAAIRALMDAE